MALTTETQAELLKNVSNFRLKLIKEFNDPNAILEGYIRGDMELHVHVIWHVFVPDMQKEREGVGGDACCLAVCATSRPALHGGAGVILGDDEMAVLVRVRDGAECLRPIRSIARLQKLDHCRMLVGHPHEMARTVTGAAPLAPSLEHVRIVINRELSILLLAAGIQPSNLVDEVVEASPHGLNCFANQDAESSGDDGSWGSVAIRGWFAGLRLDVDCTDHGIAFTFGNTLTQDYEIAQVFFCPFKPSLSAVERWGRSKNHEVELDYERQEDTEDAKGLHDTSPDSPRGRGRAGQDGQAEEVVSHPSPPEEVASRTSPDHRSGGCSAKRTRSGSPEDA